ncbi:MAG: fibronectin type III domain-containing protein [Chitinophagaceae bacterium]
MDARVKVGFKDLSVPNKIQKALRIISCIANNTAFPTPNPSVAALELGVQALEDAYQTAIDGGRSLKAALALREAELDTMFRLLAGYVTNVSGGNAEIIRSSGFEVYAGASAATSLEKPLNLRAVTSRHANQLLVSWKPVKGAKIYVVEKSTDGANGWTVCGFSTRRQMVVAGLPALQYFSLRIAAIGASGQSPWSDVARGLVV